MRKLTLAAVLAATVAVGACSAIIGTDTAATITETHRRVLKECDTQEALAATGAADAAVAGVAEGELAAVRAWRAEVCTRARAAAAGAELLAGEGAPEG